MPGSATHGFVRLAEIARLGQTTRLGCGHHLQSPPVIRRDDAA
jgi:hypothetical protein